MDTDDRGDFDTREARFFTQLPPVLVAAAAIALIFVVNAGAPPQHASPQVAPTESGRSLPLHNAPGGKPATHADAPARGDDVARPEAV